MSRPKRRDATRRNRKAPPPLRNIQFLVPRPRAPRAPRAPREPEPNVHAQLQARMRALTASPGPNRKNGVEQARRAAAYAAYTATDADNKRLAAALFQLAENVRAAGGARAARADPVLRARHDALQALVAARNTELAVARMR